MSDNISLAICYIKSWQRRTTWLVILVPANTNSLLTVSYGSNDSHQGVIGSDWHAPIPQHWSICTGSTVGLLIHFWGTKIKPKTSISWTEIHYTKKIKVNILKDGLQLHICQIKATMNLKLSKLQCISYIKQIIVHMLAHLLLYEMSLTMTGLMVCKMQKTNACCNYCDFISNAVLIHLSWWLISHAIPVALVQRFHRMFQCAKLGIIRGKIHGINWAW